MEITPSGLVRLHIPEMQVRVIYNEIYMYVIVEQKNEIFCYDLKRNTFTHAKNDKAIDAFNKAYKILQNELQKLDYSSISSPQTESQLIGV